MDGGWARFGGSAWTGCCSSMKIVWLKKFYCDEVNNATEPLLCYDDELLENEIEIKELRAIDVPIR